MLLNLWSEELSTDFMNLYNISPLQMCNILKQLMLNNDKDNIIIFCEETGLKLDTINVVDDDLEFVGKIVSTTIDDCDNLKKNGLIPIDMLLEHPSPIQQHLKNHKIEIIPSAHELIYMGKHYFIPSWNQDCQYCAYNENKCRYSQSRYKNMCCPYLDAISNLSTKLYSHKSEIEMFLAASQDTMLSYSRVIDYPEMLFTIEKFIYDFFNKRTDLCLDWEKQKQYSYIITFNIKYKDMSYRTNYVDSKYYADASNTFYDYRNYCQNIYYDINQVPKCFWDNVWLISTCLSVIGSFGRINGEICAGMKHNLTIPYNKLNIEIIPNNP